MIILSIDTTTTLGSVAISDNGRILAQEQQGVAGTHSKRLILSIDHILSLAGLKQTGIEAIAVAVGPGSFTGLRVGMATAKGMAIALGCKIVGVSSLESLALNGRGFEGTVVPLIDARRGEIFSAAWSVSLNGKLKALLKECVLPPEELIKKLKSIKGEILLVGDGAIACGERIAKVVGRRVHIAEGTALLPQAINLAELALPRLKKGKGDDVVALVPNYIRYSDAEIGFLGKKIVIASEP